MNIKKDLIKLCKDVLFDEPMKNHTSFKIGGSAQIFCQPQNAEEIINLIKYFKENKIDFFVIGYGSNLLVSDDGIEGAVIKIGDRMSEISVDGNRIKANAGALLSKTAKFALKEGLSGMEELSGIPGSIGGAVYMNAGAYGREMKDVVKEVTYITKDLKIETLKNEDLCFDYRKSIFTDSGDIVISCVFELVKDDKEKIEEKMKEFTKRRNEKQPITYPSAGSTFKRPQGYFAGKLIEDCNLKGYSIGGAQISQKHAGFIINTGNAKAKDVLDLIDYTKKCVKEKFDVLIEPEVKIIGKNI